MKFPVGHTTGCVCVACELARYNAFRYAEQIAGCTCLFNTPMIVHCVGCPLRNMEDIAGDLRHLANQGGSAWSCLLSIADRAQANVDEIARLKSELCTVRTHNTNQAVTIRRLDPQIDSLRERLAAAQSKLDSFQRVECDLRAETIAAKQKLADAETTIAQVQKALDYKNNVIDADVKSMMALQKIIRDLREQLTAKATEKVGPMIAFDGRLSGGYERKMMHFIAQHRVQIKEVLGL